MKSCLSLLLMITLSLGMLPLLKAEEGSQPIPVKVVVISMYEIGDIAGDKPGEYQFWVEREKLSRIYPLDTVPYDPRMNEEGVMGFCTGPGVAMAATSILALGLDERFDFSKTYWIVSGIAGGDPEDVSLASGAWANWVVDGEMFHSIDSREAPADWPYGIFPTDGKRPNERGDGWTYGHMAFKLNPTLVEWAYQLTKNTELMDTPALAKFRNQFAGFPNATKPPFIMKGDSMGANTYWHGERLNNWANDWIKLYTDGEGNFAMTNQEDNGTLLALTKLSETGRVDLDRVLVFRTASNYSRQPPGKGADWSTTTPYPDSGVPALETCDRAASRVVHTLVEGWDEYEEAIPSTD
jgi:purine nucleoside permease